MLYVLSNYPLLQKQLLEKKITLKEIPIMVFCYYECCNAAKKLAEILNSDDLEISPPRR